MNNNKNYWNTTVDIAYYLIHVAKEQLTRVNGQLLFRVKAFATVVKLGHETTDLALRDRFLLVIRDFFFSFEFEETCTLTTFVEQKLSL